jgi:hypothetical protein
VFPGYGERFNGPLAALLLRVVELSVYLPILQVHVAQLVLAAHAEAGVAIEGHGTGFAYEGVALDVFLAFHSSRLR